MTRLPRAAVFPDDAAVVRIRNSLARSLARSDASDGAAAAVAALRCISAFVNSFLSLTGPRDYNSP